MGSSPGRSRLMCNHLFQVSDIGLCEPLVIGGGNMLICVIRNGYNFINKGHVWNCFFIFQNNKNSWYHDLSSGLEFKLSETSITDKINYNKCIALVIQLYFFLYSLYVYVSKILPSIHKWCFCFLQYIIIIYFTLGEM